MENKHFQEVLRKVLNTTNLNQSSSVDFYKFGSLLLLFMEHCRLCAMWAAKLNYQGNRIPRNQLLQLLNNTWNSHDSEELIADVLDKFSFRSHGDIRLYFSWHLHRNEIDLMNYNDLPYDPYEPLWQFILRNGGGIKHDSSGLIDICASEFIAPKTEDFLKKILPFIDIHDETALNKADTEYIEDKEKFIENYITPYLKVYRLL